MKMESIIRAITMKSSNFRLVAAAVAGCAIAPGVAYALTPVETRDIQFMRQEEKLARDVYDGLYIVWGKKIFSNIADSERNHIAALVGLIETYGLTDPAPVEPGRFSIPELQELYDVLMEKGNRSLIDALLVGVLIEEVDIADLDRAIESSSQDDISAVYANLRSGSESHLAAFTKQLTALYQPLEAPTLSVDFDSGGYPVLSWWPENPEATAIRVSRRAYGTDPWDTVSDLPGNTATLTDNAVGVETTTYRVTVISDFEEIDSNTVTVLRPFASFAEWADAANIPVNVKTPADDADRDGSANLFEYITGSNPLVSSSGLIDIFRSGDSVVFAHPLRTSINDYAIGYESSDNLRDWAGISGFETGNTAIGVGVAEMRITVPVAARTYFLRIAAEQF